MMRAPRAALASHARERPPLLTAGGAEQTPCDPVFSLTLGSSVHVADYRKSSRIVVRITI